MDVPGPESVLNPPPNKPLLEVATKTAFTVLAEEPDHEIVLGALVATPRGWRPSGAKSPEWFKALAASGQPGFALAAMNFHLEDNPAFAGFTLLTTETRVYATDAPTAPTLRPLLARDLSRQLADPHYVVKGN